MLPALPPDDLDLVLAHTQSFWSRFQGARLFVTGGTGFIGNWLLQTVQHANDSLNSRIEVVALSRDPQHAMAARPQVFGRSDTHLVCGDVTTFQAPDGPLDLCIHAATDVADPKKSGDALRVYESIVAGTQRVLHVAKTKGVSRFLLASSGAVYGPQPPELDHVPESYLGGPDPLKISAAYGNGKRAAEWLTCASSGAERGHFEASIARIFALVGPGIPLNGPFAAGNFVRNVLASAPIVIEGDGRPVRSYLYTADLCIWLLRILESGQSGHAYNVGSEHPLSIRQLAGQVAEVAAVETEIEVRLAANTQVLPPRYVPSTLKARQSLQLQEFTTLEESLRRTLQWNRLAMTS